MRAVGGSGRGIPYKRSRQEGQGRSLAGQGQAGQKQAGQEQAGQAGRSGQAARMENADFLKLPRPVIVLMDVSSGRILYGKGRYHTPHGQHHENHDLHPGAGTWQPG